MKRQELINFARSLTNLPICEASNLVLKQELSLRVIQDTTKRDFNNQNFGRINVFVENDYVTKVDGIY